jgi:hypothetical protein
MKKIALIAAFMSVCTLSCAAQDRGYWRAASNMAGTITGDITISDAKVTLNFFAFPLAPIRSLKPVEVAAAFDADVSAGINGQLYRLKIPADKRFLHHNTLCGNEDTDWMATYVTGRSLRVIFFSGSDQPVFTVDAITKSNDICGVYTYTR